VPAVMCGLAACRSDAVEPIVTDPTTAYWSLELDHRAIAMSTVAPHNTIQLTAVPRSPSGAALEGLPAPRYASGNTDALTVSSTGLVTARSPAFGVPIVATLTAGGITHVDSAFVQVVPDPAPTVASFSIAPLPGDSAKWAITGLFGEPIKTLTPVVLDPLGTPLFVPVHFRSLDNTVSRIDPRSGALAPVRRGTVTFIASTTAYGTVMADTLPFTIGAPLIAVFHVERAPGGSATRFNPSRITVGSGALVLWENATGIATDVTFEDPASAEAVPEWEDCAIGMPCEPGNIPEFTAHPGSEDPFDLIVNGRRLRRFSAPGTYTFRSTRFGTTGTIVVVSE
jgi:plastocyanin